MKRVLGKISCDLGQIMNVLANASSPKPLEVATTNCAAA